MESNNRWFRTLNKHPILTVLSFSGGKQSSLLLWMVILGVIDKPKDFVVLFANPGMENSKTYKYVDMMENKCIENGIDFYRVSNGDLYKDIVTLSQTKKKRLDNPAYWTLGRNGNATGRLRQSCTDHYKIVPMRRKIREILYDKFGISKKSKRLGNGIVENWIGFSYDEVVRVKPSPRKYIVFRYPLIELKMSNEDVITFYTENDLPIPPRSVCNACFANGLATLKEMHDTRPNDWMQAVEVDNSVRDWSQIGVEENVFVSRTLIPLQELPGMNFTLPNEQKDIENDYSCDSGFCFV